MQYPIYHLIAPKAILSKVKRNIKPDFHFKHENDLIL